MSSVLCLSFLVAFLLFVGRPCSATWSPGVRIPRNSIWQPQITEAPQSLLGVAGSSYELPCDIRAPTPDDSVILVLWYKDGAVTPLYTLDARRRKLSQARHSTDRLLTGRAYLHTNRQPAILRLDLLLEEDEGQYRCRVDFRNARTRYFDLILTVIVPPKEPVIMDQNGTVVHNVIGPYNGDRVYLVCETEGGKPTPSLTWWMENELVDGSYEVSDDGVVRNEIAINVQQPDVLWATFTCQATNNHLIAPVSNYVTVDMNYSDSVPVAKEIEMNMSEITSITTDIINEITPIALKYGYLDVVEVFCPIGNRGILATSVADSGNESKGGTYSSTHSVAALGRIEARFSNDDEAVIRRPLMNAPSFQCPVCECSDRNGETISDASLLSRSGVPTSYKRK